MNAHPTPLKFLFPGWFAIVMGLAGLALAWHRAEPLMGETATGVALVVGALALLVFVVLSVATLWRWRRHPEAWAEDRRHPVRHTFVATLPIAGMLLATVAVALGLRGAWLAFAWGLAAAAQAGVTLWVLSRWWRPAVPATPDRPARPAGLAWPALTPALFIPVVGNVLAPLAGVPLGLEAWAAAQFGVGLLFWPVVLVLLMVRLATQGPWPDRLLPTGFILIAPPAVVGLAAGQLGAPAAVVWACWGMAVFTAAWVATLLPRLRALPFGLPHWAMSFPMAALSALTLKLAVPGSPLTVLGPALLALTSLLILGLLAGTWRGLRDGTLLAPEPVAALQPAAAP